MSLIEIKKKLLMAQGGGLDVSDVFNTSIWTGTGAARTITTGIDSSEGSLVWIKRRDSGYGHVLFDTIRGAGNYISSNENSAQTLNINFLSGFTSSGYSIVNEYQVNFSGGTYVGWQFRRAPKFFDIVQYTGNGVSGRQIAHNLGVEPGLIIVKQYNGLRDWPVYHRSLGSDMYALLNKTDSFAAANVWTSTEPNSASFFVSSSGFVNNPGGTYIAYLFAHDPSPEGIIQCGSYVGNGSVGGPSVHLGWQPQYLVIKNSTSTGNWLIYDSSRGFGPGNDSVLFANTNSVETTNTNYVNPTATGFKIDSGNSNVNQNGQTYIYMAIRGAV